MKTIVIVMLAWVVSPAFADVYKCNSGSKTIYQDEPCPNAKVIDNLNGQAPSPHEQIKATERAKREQALATRLREHRETQDRRDTTTTSPTSTTTTQITVSPSPIAPKTNQPDRYYDRPDRYSDRLDKYKNRTVSN